jgi:hypothetical protein
MRLVPIVLGAATVVLTVVAVIYLVVACQSLPGLLGPVAGDTHPRTRLGAGLLLVAVIMAIGAVLTVRPRPTRS